MEERACRKCRALTIHSACPIDGSKNLSDEWSGLIVILDPERSDVARSMGFNTAGRFALKVL